MMPLRELSKYGSLARTKEAQQFFNIQENKDVTRKS